MVLIQLVEAGLSALFDVNDVALRASHGSQNPLLQFLHEFYELT